MSAQTISIDTNAVIIAVSNARPYLRVVESPEMSLPAGQVADDDRTITESIRRWVHESTGLELGYVEQLYTFGDADRAELDSAGSERVLSIAYLALVDGSGDELGPGWIDIYELFPWEDGRSSDELDIRAEIASKLDQFITKSNEESKQARLERSKILFPADANLFDGVRALERYELMYEAGLLAEAGAESGYGQAMYLDHRRIAATALARIRGKLTYRPVVFELLSTVFTLRELQGVVEALLGSQLHKQNFRRSLETKGLVEPTGEYSTPSGGGRPAELFKFRREVLLERPRPGIK